jgi:membrane protease subunit HflK
MQEVFSNVSKVMIEAKSGSNLLYLPLDKILNRSNKSSNSSSPGTTGPVDSPIGAVSRAAENVRNVIGNNNRSAVSLRDRLREVR